MAVETEVMAKAARPVDGELRIESRLSVDWESEHGR